MLYAIAQWCWTEKKVPRSIYIWIEDVTNVYKANVNYCDDKDRMKEISKVNKKIIHVDPTEEFIKSMKEDIPNFGYQDVRPVLDEHNVSEEMDELTECERSYGNYLKEGAQN
jgi:hypothetical protein